MRPREDILKELISASTPLSSVLSELSQYPWDPQPSDKLVTLRAADICAVLQRFLSCELVSAEVEKWAEALESREDVEFDPTRFDQIKAGLHVLANPTLTQELTSQLAIRLIHDLAGPNAIRPAPTSKD
jgi:hypothetical protein